MKEAFDLIKERLESMNKWQKADRIIFDLNCIVFVLIAPVFLLRILGFERMCWNESD